MRGELESPRFAEFGITHTEIVPELYRLILEIRCIAFSSRVLGTAEDVQWPFEIPIRTTWAF